ncbi:MAG: sulfite exporter TauE/SafE family protein, partial [Deltaproteobacteria bacterium]
RAEGVSGFRDAGPLLIPVILGSVVGALLISSLADETFETLFGLVMIALLFPILRRPTPAPRAGGAPGRGTLAVFFAIGLYGGAFQAGVGIALVFALAYAGYDLVRANSIKMVVNAALVAMAVPVFALRHQIDWSYALVLSVGFVLGAEIGARVAVRGGERAIRPVLALAVVALAGRMIGLY